MSENQPRLDLLGDPIPENHGRRGRPAHIPTNRNRLKIRLALAEGWTTTRIARALRITKDTLRKHYFVDLRQREEARPAIELERRMLLYEAMHGGNVGAMKEYGRILERLDLQRPQISRPAKPARLGKKEAAEQAALEGHEDTGWARLVN